jgi:hypothetical protein
MEVCAENSTVDYQLLIVNREELKLVRSSLSEMFKEEFMTSSCQRDKRRSSLVYSNLVRWLILYDTSSHVGVGYPKKLTL